MFESLNELKYTAENGKTYLIYFLKFWVAEDTHDFLTKYQIRRAGKEIFWYARMSRERAAHDLNLPRATFGKTPSKALQTQVAQHLKKLFVHVIKKGLDRGFEESHTEFVFSVETPIEKRTWHE
ncbi:hypothetical protein AMJ87_00885 [candidate division WOR_3 bacterium SM23_60]|uniref:Uncharacterized protein n=1 Tax=candidate division WOR_3 bacterium SM23_60 TaxID=1703780 RepID=A0A0S8GLB8_UNCW3|nr:MAG: hypothetical protein AMJ87_00885 [candidate division WOR_3 bacterium SM23_60]